MTCIEFLEATSAAAWVDVFSSLILCVLCALVLVMLFWRVKSQWDDLYSDDAAGYAIGIAVAFIMVLVFLGLMFSNINTAFNPQRDSETKFFCAENPPTVCVEK